jgi:threonine dehydratase
VTTQGDIDLVGEAPLTVERIRAAAGRIAGVAHRTGVVRCKSLNDIAKAHILAKPEMFQRSGSFKFRGAYNRLAQLTPEQRAAGVVTYSSGNHGAAVALAASILGVGATVVVPPDASTAKVAAIRAQRAEVRTFDPDVETREGVAGEVASRTGAVLVPPYEDYEVMAGQGTLALELAADVNELDTIVVPIGGGGLMAGVATAIKAVLPSCRIIGVEPQSADDTRVSLRAGHIERNTSLLPETIADGLRAPQPGALTFAVNRRLVDDVVVVSDESLVEAMRFCYERMKVVVEPSGAVGIAAILTGAIQVQGQRVGVVLSGGNIAAAVFAALIARPLPSIRLR